MHNDAGSYAEDFHHFLIFSSTTPVLFYYFSAFLPCFSFSIQFRNPKKVLSQYTASINNTISLPCNVSDWNRKAISLMLWYKDKQRVPFYSVDAREASLDEAKKNGLDPRIILNETLTITTPYLVIHGVKDSDDGEYRCRVDYRDDKTQHSIVYLQVVGKFIITELAILLLLLAQELYHGCGRFYPPMFSKKTRQKG